jgi:hypothetical protein
MKTKLFFILVFCLFMGTCHARDVLFIGNPDGNSDKRPLLVIEKNQPARKILPPEGWSLSGYDYDWKLSPDGTKLLVTYVGGTTTIHPDYYRNYSLFLYDLIDTTSSRQIWESQDDFHVEWAYDNQHILIQTQLPNGGIKPEALFHRLYCQEKLDFDKNNPLKIYSLDIQTNKTILISPQDKDTLYSYIFNDIKHPENVYFFTVDFLEIPENCRRNMAPPEIKHIYYGPKPPWAQDICVGKNDDQYGYVIKGIYCSNILTGQITDETNLWGFMTTHFDKAFVADSCFYILQEDDKEIPRSGGIYDRYFRINKWEQNQSVPEMFLKWKQRSCINGTDPDPWILSLNGQYIGISQGDLLYLINTRSKSARFIRKNDCGISTYAFSGDSNNLFYWTKSFRGKGTYYYYLHRYNIPSDTHKVIYKEKRIIH